MTCTECGYTFTQRANAHLGGRGCPNCNKLIKKQKLSTDPESIVEVFKERRLDEGRQYDYSKVKYINMRAKVEIICPIHGPFWQTPLNHIQNHDCPKCGTARAKMKNSLTWEEFYDKLKTKRADGGRQYDYSQVEYVNKRTPIKIVCPIHGPFWQLPNDHAKGCGCPTCKCSQLEAKVAAELNVLGIKYKPQAKFSWLGRQSLDFYLPEYNIAIECQGAQHYIETEIFGPLQIIKDRDRKKRQLCYRNDVRLYYVKYTEKDIPTRVQKILTKCK